MCDFVHCGFSQRTNCCLKKKKQVTDNMYKESVIPDNMIGIANRLKKTTAVYETICCQKS